MDSFLLGELWVIVNHYERCIERIYQGKPVWTNDLDRIKKYKTQKAALAAMEKIDAPVGFEVKQLKDVFNYMYYIGTSTEKKNYGAILCGLYWIHNRANYDPNEFFTSREEAQEALDKLKQNTIFKYHQMVMMCRDIKLPDPDMI